MLARFIQSWLAGCVLLGVALLSGCVAAGNGKSGEHFFTSGNREADQRAGERMAQAEQLADSKTDESETSGSTEGSTGNGTVRLQAKGKLDLFERLGGVPGITNIVADFLPRATNDPRINWSRAGLKSGWLSWRESPVWNPSVANVEVLEKRLIQFLCLATGGPAEYEGRDLKSSHARLRITNAEFDATIGDLKTSLDRLRVPDREQKELLAIVESTRPQIVSER